MGGVRTVEGKEKKRRRRLIGMCGDVEGQPSNSSADMLNLVVGQV
jgi:hypothetical protein